MQLEPSASQLVSRSVRLGLKYAHGLREPAGQALVRERSLAPFASVQDLARRVPELRKDELTTLAEIGALNTVASERVVLKSPSSPRCALAGGAGGALVGAIAG